MDGFIKPPVCIRLKGTDVGLRLLCFGMFHIHLFVATRHDIRLKVKSIRGCFFFFFITVFLKEHCLLENVRGYFHFILHAKCLIKQSL